MTTAKSRLLLPSFARHLRARQNFPKRCSCGRLYSYVQWRKLPRLRDWVLPWGEVQELRNCICKSTMGIVVKDGDTEDA